MKIPYSLVIGYREMSSMLLSIVVEDEKKSPTVLFCDRPCMPQYWPSRQDVPSGTIVEWMLCGHPTTFWLYLRTTLQEGINFWQCKPSPKSLPGKVIRSRGSLLLLLCQMGMLSSCLQNIYIYNHSSVLLSVLGKLTFALGSGQCRDS